MGNIESSVKDVVSRYGKNASRLMDIVSDLQKELGSISDEASRSISKELGISKVDVDGVVTFYHFYSKNPHGTYSVFLLINSSCGGHLLRMYCFC